MYSITNKIAYFFSGVLTLRKLSKAFGNFPWSLGRSYNNISQLSCFTTLKAGMEVSRTGLGIEASLET